MATAKGRRIASPWKRDERVAGDNDHIDLDLGDVDMAELYSIRGRMGLKVEREYHWQPDRTLAEYAERARHSGRAES